MINTSNAQNIDASNIQIGSIVALQTHPYTNSDSTIIISGDTTHISPLMVVIEIQKTGKTTYDEHTGVKQDELQLKCLYYSNKDQLEEIWLSSNLLKVIKKEERKNFIDKENSSDLKTLNELFTGQQAVISTLPLELKKRKSYLRTESDNLDSKKNRIEGLLTYLSPVMQITEVRRYDHKDALYDARSGKQKRYVSSWVAKCKWFNSESGKFNEKFISVDALQLLPLIRPSTIENLQSDISKGFYFPITKQEGSTHIIKPKNIYYRSGFYYLEYYDFISNRIRESKIKSNEQYATNRNTYFLERHPDFNFADGVVTTSAQRRENMISAISQAKTNKNFIRLEYKNHYDILTIRTLDNFEVITIQDDGNQIQYLNGYCYLRKENRIFRIDRIQKLEVLDAKYVEII